MNLHTEQPLAMQMAHALVALDKARQLVGALRGQVARQEAGAASLTTAEWQLQQALRNVERLRSQQDYQPPTAA